MQTDDCVCLVQWMTLPPHFSITTYTSVRKWRWWRLSGRHAGNISHTCSVKTVWRRRRRFNSRRNNGANPFPFYYFTVESPIWPSSAPPSGATKASTSVGRWTSSQRSPPSSDSRWLFSARSPPLPAVLTEALVLTAKTTEEESSGRWTVAVEWPAVKLPFPGVHLPPPHLITTHLKDSSLISPARPPLDVQWSRPTTTTAMKRARIPFPASRLVSSTDSPVPFRTTVWMGAPVRCTKRWASTSASKFELDQKSFLMINFLWFPIFSVKHRCADGYRGQRCEFKDINKYRKCASITTISGD